MSESTERDTREVLEPGERVVDDSLRLEVHPMGFRYVARGERQIASESNSSWAHAAKLAVQVPTSGRVAVIGGGFCLLPRLLPGRAISVFELEAALARFCTDWEFVPGDWRETLPRHGFLFDCIVYDVGDEPDLNLLRASLAPGGVLLGVE